MRCRFSAGRNSSVHHGEQHFADVLRLARLRRAQIEAADLGDSGDEAGDFFAEAFADLLDGNARVFDDVVQQGGAQRGDVEAHVREQVRDLERVRHVGLAGLARLAAVLLGGEVEGAAQQIDIAARALLRDARGQLLKARGELLLRGASKEIRLAL